MNIDITFTPDPADEAYWGDTVDRLVELFHFSEEEKRSLSNNSLLKMLTLLPRFAFCDNADGTGLLVACTYITERKVGRDLFEHSPADDFSVLSRLKPFRKLMEGGDPRIIEKGLNLAALTMVKDYADDAEEDAARGKYNPIASGAWNWAEIKAAILKRNEEIFCPQMEVVYGPEIALNAFWVMP